MTVDGDRRGVVAWLRLEGVAAFVAGLAYYGVAGGEWLLAIPLLLLPDVSVLGYLRGPALGAAIYNLVHNWATALLVFGAGVVADVEALRLFGAILVAHVGIDRLMGFGLKYPSDFRDTHLGRIGRR